MATRYPLLFFPEPISLPKDPGVRRKFPQIHIPTHQRQKERLSPIFDTLFRSFETERNRIQQAVDGLDPEQVLVFETIGDVNGVLTAIKHTEGLEWMGEIEIEDIDASEDFHFAEKAKESNKLSGRLFLTMTNERAMREMLSLWNLYSDDPDVEFKRGFSGFKVLFKHLSNIRKWDIHDRLIETGALEYFAKEIEADVELIRFEVQLWFNQSPEKRALSFRNLLKIIESQDGRCLAHSEIEEISYHAILVELPSSAISQIIESLDTQLVKCDQVMFFRPAGQVAIISDDTAEYVENTIGLRNSLPSGDPEAAIFDGLPLNNHNRLDGRIILDDPDNYSENYLVEHRKHGTAMNSLIIHGDINDNEDPITTPLYVRPIMRPVFGISQMIERVPDDVLFVDILHRAVKRIFEGDSDSKPLKSIKLINLSIGDSSILFYHSMSPAAKLLDWLSWKYSVLFIISTGNHVGTLELPIPYRDFKTLSGIKREQLIYQAIINDRRNRRILSPSESINNIAVGSISIDNSSSINPTYRRINPTTQLLPNVYSAFGGGYRKSIKPDFVYIGGGQFFEEPMLENSPTSLRYSCNYAPPGNLVAAPSSTLNDQWFVRGTSNSAALITRRGIQISDTLKMLFEANYSSPLYRQYIPLIIKTLLAHGCSWGQIETNLINILDNSIPGRAIKKIITDWVGYGVPDFDKVKECTEQRVTILGFGQITQDQIHLFKFPLPASLSGRLDARKLTITLSWFSPIASNTQKYRVANLSFDSQLDTLGLGRDDVDYHKVKKGTLQHEVFIGEKAMVFEEDGNINIRVICKKDAKDFTNLIPYSIAATLEVAEEIDLPIYQEVRERLRTPIIIEPNSVF